MSGRRAVSASGANSVRRSDARQTLPGRNAATILTMASATVSQQPSPLKVWSAWVPIAIPVFLLSLVVRYVGIHGAVGEADEGIEAHLFQLLMPVQLVAMAYFALTWLPRSPRWTLVVLAVQIAAVFAVLAAVYWVDHLPIG